MQAVGSSERLRANVLTPGTWARLGARAQALRLGAGQRLADHNDLNEILYVCSVVYLRVVCSVCFMPASSCYKRLWRFYAESQCFDVYLPGTAINITSLFFFADHK